MASRDPEPTFNAERLLAALKRRRIRVIIVGALVARIRGFADITTQDIDLTPDLDRDNLRRLAEVLHELGATVRVENHAAGPVRLPADGGLIARAPILNLHLPGIGDVAVIHQAAKATSRRGPLTFEVLARSATLEPLPGTLAKVLVMSESDWVESKQTPPIREKDELHLAAYRRYRGRR
jgi:hypothetical protein